MAELRAGEELLLVPDPPGTPSPRVWVHRSEGDRLGHLPPEVERWLATWLGSGGRAGAWVLRVAGEQTPSYRRLLLEIACLEE